jgi:uncharacterized RDD family membrane protein YckC
LDKPDLEMDEAPRDGQPEIAGFWRRTGAFVLDTLVVGLVGLSLGLFLHDQFEAMGAWGRVVGFLVALAYFGVMESRLSHGRTLGKLALGIKVVTAAGAPLGFGKALLRSAVFYVPLFLNGAILGSGQPDLALTAIQVLLVFGLGGTIAYLYLFNVRTRQSVHDLLVGAVVVRARTAAAPRLLPVWRGHIVAVAAWFALVIGATAYIESMTGYAPLLSLMSVQQKVNRLPGVSNASVLGGTSFATGNKRINYLTIRAVTGSAAVDEKALANSIAKIALATYPYVQQMDTLSVALLHGYDIGIASSWNSKIFNGSPDDWRQGRVGK